MANKSASPKKNLGKENQNDNQQQQHQEVAASLKENNDIQAENSEQATKPASLAVDPEDKKDNGTNDPVDDAPAAMETEEDVDNNGDSKKRKHDDEETTDNANPTEDEEEKADDEEAPVNEEDKDEDDSKPAAKKLIELPPDFDLTQPIKKARTAYFIFMDERRPEVQAKFKGEGVAKLAKEMGHIWSSMEASEKEVFQTKAALEREQVARKFEQLKAAGIDLATLAGAAVPNDPNNPNALIFPVARMRKICKLDPEVRGLSKEALMLVTKCAELVTSKLGMETVRVAQIQNRRKILPDDVAQVCGSREQFLFLRDDVKDLVREQLTQKQNENETNPKGKSAAMALASSKTKKLTSFFSAK